jgi:uncharacterized protein YegP (UPF0339 family)
MSLFEIDYSNNLYYFTLQDDYREILIRSKGYIQKQSCKDGIHSVIVNIGLDARIKREKIKEESYIFSVIAINGKEVARSKEYTSLEALENGLNYIRSLFED